MAASRIVRANVQIIARNAAVTAATRRIRNAWRKRLSVISQSKGAPGSGLPLLGFGLRLLGLWPFLRDTRTSLELGSRDKEARQAHHTEANDGQTFVSRSGGGFGRGIRACV